MDETGQTAQEVLDAAETRIDLEETGQQAAGERTPPKKKGRFRPPREPDQRIRPPRPPRPPGEDVKPKRPKSRLEKMRYILTYPGNRKAFAILYRGAVHVLYRIRPRIKMADIRFSTGWPDHTGELVGALSLCPGVYEESVAIRPDFESEKPYATGMGELYGRVQLYYIVFFALRVFLSRDCRKLYRQVRQL